MSTDLSTEAEAASLYWEAESHAYVITGYDLAASVLRDNAQWSSDPANVFGAETRSSTPYLRSAIVLRDPPDHTRMRSQMAPAFSSRVVERLRPRVGAIVDTVLDGLEDGDEADIVGDIGAVVPPSVIAELFDIGVDGAMLILEQSPRLVRWMELRPTPEDIQSTIDAEAALAAFLTPIMEQRRAAPGDDFLSALVSTEGLSVDEMLTTCFIMLAAGGESTGKLIGNGTLAILREPEQIPYLVADPARAVEELLRMQGTSKRLIRIAPEDREIEGHVVPKGHIVYIDVMAANQDPRRASDADRMDLSREPLGHITMGVGAHYCLGAGLARVMASETLSRLFTRFPEMSLIDPEPEWNPSTTFRSLRALRVNLRGRP
jgi:cytochrome P450